jgi:hypothetical protein
MKFSFAFILFAIGFSVHVEGVDPTSHLPAHVCPPPAGDNLCKNIATKICPRDCCRQGCLRFICKKQDCCADGFVPPATGLRVRGINLIFKNVTNHRYSTTTGPMHHKAHFSNGSVLLPWPTCFTIRPRTAWNDSNLPVSLLVRVSIS